MRGVHRACMGVSEHVHVHEGVCTCAACGPYVCRWCGARRSAEGLNLIGGNHIVLVDPSWNPATDLQAGPDIGFVHLLTYICMSMYVHAHM